MIFTPLALPGAMIVDLERVDDARGYFARAWCEREFVQAGLNPRLVQASISHNRRRGTLRGMHYQIAPHTEVKIVSCVAGAIYDVIVDLRPASPTYRTWQGFELSAENRRQLYVPAGFAHGFQTLTDAAELNYLISAFYEPAASTGISYADPTIGIRWPLPVAVISDRDRSWGRLAA